MNKLTESIFTVLYQENLQNNFCFSPASYLEAINNLCLCLKGNNLKEILDKLGIQENDLLEYIKKYKQNLDLENYNILLYSQEYWATLNYEVINKLKEFSSDIESLDFNNSLSVVNKVNGIVSNKTHAKINNLISPDDIDGFTKFIILNCVYFKKDWLYEFSESGHEQTFNGATVNSQVKFLFETKNFQYYDDSDLDIIELPYKNSDICCYLFIPTNNRNIYDLISNLDETYSKIHLIKQDIQVSLTVPPFKVESVFDLVLPTKIAGIDNIFEYNKDWKLVDFERLLPQAAMKVDRIIQKTYFDFTKKGTEAAAATAILMVFSGCMMNFIPPKIKYIRADKPFMYVLANKNNKNEPLFMGVVNNV